MHPKRSGKFIHTNGPPEELFEKSRYMMQNKKKENKFDSKTLVKYMPKANNVKNRILKSTLFIFSATVASLFKQTFVNT